MLINVCFHKVNLFDILLSATNIFSSDVLDVLDVLDVTNLLGNGITLIRLHKPSSFVLIYDKLLLHDINGLHCNLNCTTLFEKGRIQLTYSPPVMYLIKLLFIFESMLLLDGII